MTILLLALCGAGSAQTRPEIGFDERVDLLAAVWRLAGAPEYVEGVEARYAHDFDSAFSAYKDLPAIKTAQSLYAQGISHDAVVSFALHLIPSQEGGWRLDTDLEEAEDMSYSRWNAEQKATLLKPLNDFYRETAFHHWWLGTASYRKQAAEAYDKVASMVDYEWFDHYFGGSDKSRFNIILCVLAGRHNYGCNCRTADGVSHLNPVMGDCISNPSGGVQYVFKLSFPTLIHEFCHHYGNALDAQNWQSMQKKAEKVYALKSEVLRRQAYSHPLTMMDETFVRACVIRYLCTHFPKSDEDQLAKNEEDMGFLLIRTELTSLKEYEQNREKYADMAAFMPEMVRHINQYSIRQYQREQRRMERRMATYEASIPDGACDVPEGDRTITITFSKPMTNAVSLNYSTCGADFPKVKGYRWSEDERALILDVELQGGRTYGFVVNGAGFRTQDGSCAKGSREITFSTR